MTLCPTAGRSHGEALMNDLVFLGKEVQLSLFLKPTSYLMGLKEIGQ